VCVWGVGAGVGGAGVCAISARAGVVASRCCSSVGGQQSAAKGSAPAAACITHRAAGPPGARPGLARGPARRPGHGCGAARRALSTRRGAPRPPRPHLQPLAAVAHQQLEDLVLVQLAQHQVPVKGHLQQERVWGGGGHGGHGGGGGGGGELRHVAPSGVGGVGFGVGFGGLGWG
jgi:hypothetical protein